MMRPPTKTANQDMSAMLETVRTCDLNTDKKRMKSSVKRDCSLKFS